jgi:glycosyltransferase involved in cell wall biosynthesis
MPGMLETQTVTVIIPAYNEAIRIPKVLEVVCRNDFIDRVVVVDDGSHDGTSEVAQRFPVEVIRHARNQGKGKALVSGIRRYPESDLYLFLDADLIHLRDEHLLALAEPLVRYPFLNMTIGVFKGGRGSSDLAQKIFPILNGQRAVRGSWVRELPNFSWTRFGVEVFLTKFAYDSAANVEMVPLWGLAHYHKEEKYGPFMGFYHRVKMYVEIFRAYALYENKVRIPEKVVDEKEARHYVRV